MGDIGSWIHDRIIECTFLMMRGMIATGTHVQTVNSSYQFFYTSYISVKVKKIARVYWIVIISKEYVSKAPPKLLKAFISRARTQEIYLSNYADCHKLTTMTISWTPNKFLSSHTGINYTKNMEE